MTMNWEVSDKLFEKVYWGRFESDTSSAIDSTVIENRMKFKKDFNLKSVSKEPGHYHLRGRLMDHVEQYITEDNTMILVTSPYHDVREDEIEDGWIEIAPIYANTARSFMKRI